MRTRATPKRETSRRRGMKPAARDAFSLDPILAPLGDTADPGVAARARPLRSATRQGFLRRRLHRRHQGPQVAPDRRRRARRSLCNLEHRGAVGADPRAGDGAGILVQIPHRLLQEGRDKLGFKLPDAGRIRDRRSCSCRPTRIGGRSSATSMRRRSSARACTLHRLARRADRQLDARRKREADRAGAPAGVHRPRQEDQERGRFRAPALHPAQVDLERDLCAPRAPAVELLPGVDLLPHGRLQGHVPGRPARHLLSRPARPGFRERARAGASALLDQHVPDLVARASLPDDRPQRRNQHAARQQQLDGGAAGVGVVTAVRRRHHPSCGRSPTKASPTPPASTTRSNSWCRAATRSRTR